MKNYRYCQTPNLKSAIFCKKCGHKIIDVEAKAVFSRGSKKETMKVAIRPFHLKRPE